MRRRSAVMAALSTIFLIMQLTAMALAVTSGLGSTTGLVGSASYAILISLVAVSLPIAIFAVVTILLLAMERSQGTGRRYRNSLVEASMVPGEPYHQGRSK